MKLRLTEGQYKRLLSEDNKSFLDGQVDFKNIGNKIDGFIAKCFEYIYQMTSSGEYVERLTRKFMEEFSFTEAEATILSHNYANIDDKTGDFKKFIGEPLEYYGKFRWQGHIPVMAYVNGTVDGSYTGYATSPEEFYSLLEAGDYEDVMDDGGLVDYDEGNLEWEIDHDWAAENLGNQINELDKDDVIDNITIED